MLSAADRDKMQIHSLTKHIDWRVFTLFVVIIFLFSCVAVTHSEIFDSYSHDVLAEETYCASQHKHLEEHGENNCKSFWYRTLNDPAIAWNFYYSLLTALLVAFAAGTIVVAVRSSRVQRGEAQRLFVADQRPWIRVRFTPYYRTAVHNENGDMISRYQMVIENIGKTPAVKMSKSQFIFHQSTLNTNAVDKDLRILRDQAKGLMRVGRTLFPGVSEEFESSIVIPKKYIDATWDQKEQDLYVNVVMQSIFYQSIFADSDFYETSECITLSPLGPLAPLPRDKRELSMMREFGFTAPLFRSIIT